MATAARILEDLRQAGIVPEVLDGNRLAFPPGVLSDDMRYHVRQHKAELIELLQADQATLAARYHSHHFACRACIAAGQNPNLQRCPAGLPLWQGLNRAYGASKPVFKPYNRSYTHD